MDEHTILMIGETHADVRALKNTMADVARSQSDLRGRVESLERRRTWFRWGSATGTGLLGLLLAKLFERK